MAEGGVRPFLREFLTGVRSVPQVDRVLSTVLFTDIVGSTERAAALGDRDWSDFLANHNGRVRALLAQYRGREVGTAGDGFLATFDGPARPTGSSVRDPSTSSTPRAGS